MLVIRRQPIHGFLHIGGREETYPCHLEIHDGEIAAFVFHRIVTRFQDGVTQGDISYVDVI